MNSTNFLEVANRGVLLLAAERQRAAGYRDLARLLSSYALSRPGSPDRLQQWTDTVSQWQYLNLIQDIADCVEDHDLN